MASDVIIRIGGKADQYQAELDKVGKETENLEKQLTKVAKISAAAFVGFAGTIGITVAAFARQEQALLRQEAVLKSTGNAAGLNAKQLQAMAAGLQKVTTFGDEAVIEAQNLLLTFKQIGADVFPAATATILDVATAMDIDLKSASVQVGKALNDPATGLSMLTRVGITFTEEQKKTIKSLQDLGDIAGAQKIILGELESQFGGAAKAAASGTGAFKQLSNSFGDLLENIGKNFVPVLAGAAKKTTEFIEIIKNNQTLVRLASIFLAAGTAVTGLIAGLSTGIVVFLNFRKAILASEIATKLLSFSVKGLVGATGIGLLLILVSEVATRVEDWGAIFEATKSILITGVKTLGSVFSDLGSIIANVFTGNFGEIEKSFENIKKTIASAGAEAVRETQKAIDAQSKPVIKVDVEADRDPASSGKNVAAAEAEARAIAEKKREVAAEEAEIDAEFATALNELKREERAALTEEELESLRGQFLSKRQIESEFAQSAVKKAAEERKLFRKDEIKSNTAVAKSNAFFRTEEIKAVGIGLGNLATLTASKNRKLFEIGKAAAVANAIINTAQGATKALAQGGVIGPILAATVIASGFVQVANIKDQKFTGAAEGGLLSGGIPGVDSIPLLAQQGELIAPERNFDEVVNSVADSRNSQKTNLEAVDDVEPETQGGGNISINFNSEEAESVITVEQNEARALGTSRENE